MERGNNKKKSLSYYLFKKQIFVLDDIFKKSQWIKDKRVHKLTLCIVTSLIITFLISQKFKITTYDYQKGDIAKSNIKATIDLKIEDFGLTEKKKQEAKELVLSVYDYDSKIPLEIQKNVSNAFELIKQAYLDHQKKVDEIINNYTINTGISLEQAAKEQKSTGAKGVSEGKADMLTMKVGEIKVKIPKDKKEQFKADIDAIQKPEDKILAMKGDFEAALKITLSDDDYELLLKERFALSIKNAVKDIISKAMGNYIVRDKGLLSGDKGKGIRMRKIETQEEEIINDIGFIKGYKDMEGIVAEVSKDILKDFESKKLVNTILLISKQLITPNLTFNKNETETRKTKAVEGASPVFFEIKKGEIIVREGDRVEKHHILKLGALNRTKNKSKFFPLFIGMFIMLTTLILVTYNFASKNIRKFTTNFKDILLICVVAVTSILIAKSFIFLSEALATKMPGITIFTYRYAIPFALGAMAIRIVLNSETAIIYSFLSSFFFALLLDNSIIIFVYSFVGSLVGALGVTHCKQRTTLIKAGLMVSFVNVLMIISFNILGLKPDLFTVGYAAEIVSGITNGIILSILISGLIPIIEALFGYTTDIKLLELANLDHPLLKELPISAPGTYQHSIIVGSMVEEAADIGKIKKAHYFIENQREIDNKHDKLSPSMSSLIIISHIRDGVELAKEYKLGKSIIDVIQQHHGTGLIKFFYEKAKSAEKDRPHVVNEKDFRYPGPKPQTKEAGLVLLADVVEAAAKTLPEFTSARVQGLVQKMINKVFSDGQLDECELTLKDLNEIARAFNRVLNAIYHQRIEYPEPAYKQSERKQKTNGDTNKKQSPKDSDKPGEDKEEDKEDLKRLGL
jgi:putative nucleotidyltransferase with HDIG domain